MQISGEYGTELLIRYTDERLTRDLERRRIALERIAELNAEPRRERAPVRQTVVTRVAALFHGLAHGGEVPAAASPALYVAGFLIATAGLQFVGVALGPVVARSRVHRTSAGIAVAAAGLALLGGV